MYGFLYDFVKPKYGEKAISCYMDTESLTVYRKTEYINVDIAKDVETGFDTSNYELKRPIPREKNKKFIRLMKDVLNDKRMEKLASFRQKK